MPTAEWYRMALGGGCGSCYVVDTAPRLGIQFVEEPELSSHDNETPHLPPPNLWPIGFAIGIACVLIGLVVSTLVAIVGAVIAAIFGFLWIRDVTAPVRTGAPPSAEPAEATPVLRSSRAPRAVEGAAAMPV